MDDAIDVVLDQRSVEWCATTHLEVGGSKFAEKEGGGKAKDYAVGRKEKE